jgi:hypothetical protein
MSNYDETEVQYDSYDEGEQGDGLIRIQSRHGNPETGSVFRFFLGKDNVPEGFTPGAPWVAHKEYIKSAGKHIEGWKAEALPMMIICARAQAFRKGKDEKREAWVDSWPKDAPPNSHGMHCDVLLIARGLEELGPVVWSTNGASTSFAIISGKGKRQPQGGILERIRNEVLAEADRLSQKVKVRAKNKVYWAFWITIAGQTDKDDSPVYTPTAGGNPITIPVPLLPPKVDGKWLAERYVGADLDAQGRALRAEYETWRTTRRTDSTPEPQQLMGITEAGATRREGRNVPQPVEEEAPDF